MTVLDSLIRHLPLSEKRLEMATKNIRSQLITSYPSFRSVSSEMSANKRSNGFSRDYREGDYPILDAMKLQDIEHYWNTQVAGRPIVWAVVGDPEKIGMENLTLFGPVTQLKPEDVIK